MKTIEVSTELSVIQCANCFLTFAIPARYEKERRADHQTFYCPSGHPNFFSAKSESERLRDELVRERARLDQEKAHSASLRRSLVVRERQVAARKAVATKLRKRIANGKCPCCHAQFKDLKMHMRQQHPEWNPETAAEEIAAKAEA